MTRGEIWLVNLDPTIGSEIRKTRPCVVVSPAEMHDHLRTVIVAPMTTKSRAAPFRVGVTHGGQKGLILLDQMRAVDKARLANEEIRRNVEEDTRLHPEHASGSLRRMTCNLRGACRTFAAQRRQNVRGRDPLDVQAHPRHRGAKMWREKCLVFH